MDPNIVKIEPKPLENDFANFEKSQNVYKTININLSSVTNKNFLTHCGNNDPLVKLPQIPNVNGPVVIDSLSYGKTTTVRNFTAEQALDTIHESNAAALAKNWINDNRKPKNSTLQNEELLPIKQEVFEYDYSTDKSSVFGNVSTETIERLDCNVLIKGQNSEENNYCECSDSKGSTDLLCSCPQSTSSSTVKVETFIKTEPELHVQFEGNCSSFKKLSLIC